MSFAMTGPQATTIAKRSLAVAADALAREARERREVEGVLLHNSPDTTSTDDTITQWDTLAAAFDALATGLRS